MIEFPSEFQASFDEISSIFVIPINGVYSISGSIISSTRTVYITSSYIPSSDIAFSISTIRNPYHNLIGIATVSRLVGGSVSTLVSTVSIPINPTVITCILYKKFIVLAYSLIPSNLTTSVLTDLTLTFTPKNKIPINSYILM